MMTNTNQIVWAGLKQGLVVPAFNIPYSPMMEPVIQAVIENDAFALIETARLEWTKFEAGGPEEVMKEFQRWQHPECVRLHLDQVPVIDEDNQSVDYSNTIDIPAAKQAVCERAVWLIRDCFGISGTRRQLFSDAEGGG